MKVFNLGKVPRSTSSASRKDLLVTELQKTNSVFSLVALYLGVIKLKLFMVALDFSKSYRSDPAGSGTLVMYGFLFTQFIVSGD